MDTGSSISAIPIYSYLIIIALLILGGAYFAAAETAFASVSRIRMISDADDGDARAEKVLAILDDFDKALTTLLIGNNVMHIACSSVATLFASKLWGNTGVTVMTFVITFIVFIFAEMIPKSYAKACSETLAPKLAGSISFLMKLLSPVSAFFSAVAKLIIKIFPETKEEDVTVTEEELFDIIENIDEEDKIDEETTELVQNALEFTVTTAKEVMVPWERVVTIQRRMSVDAIMKIISENHFSRLPVMDDDGNIEGVLQIKKFLKAKIRGRKQLKSKSMLDPAYYIPSTLPMDEILPDLSAHKAHMAFVKNGSNQVIGLITVEDILEELVGEIYDEEDKTEVSKQ
jgi:CBS domain containing-hemolysin-like protein